MSDSKILWSMRDIGNIGNYYGDLTIRASADKFQWSIENWDGHDWEDIPKYLYDALVRFDDEKKEEGNGV